MRYLNLIRRAGFMDFKQKQAMPSHGRHGLPLDLFYNQNLYPSDNASDELLNVNSDFTADAGLAISGLKG